MLNQFNSFLESRHKRFQGATCPVDHTRSPLPWLLASTKQLCWENGLVTDSSNSYSLFSADKFIKRKISLLWSLRAVYECAWAFSASESCLKIQKCLTVMSIQQKINTEIYQLSFISQLTNLLFFLEQSAMHVLTRQWLKICLIKFWWKMLMMFCSKHEMTQSMLAFGVDKISDIVLIMC
jgi:hypothetical protein